MLYGAVGRVGIRGLFGGFSPASLFAAGEQGVWYDPSDFSTMFQDSAGTTPVTAVEQPVGRILDKSGRGNTATQATDASRPVLSARVNLLTKTEQFDDAVWGKSNASVTAPTAIVAPNGTLTTDKLVEGIGTARKFIGQSAAFDNATISIYAQQAERSFVTIGTTNSGGLYSVSQFNLSTGAFVGHYEAGAQALQSSPTITSVENGWYRVSVFSPVNLGQTIVMVSNGGNPIFEGYTGNGTSGIYIWGADLRVTNDGVGIPAYQRVNTSTDYDTTGFPYYLRFDGTDDSLATASINFTATDKMGVFAGVRKLSDAAGGVVAELSINWTTVNGTFVVTAPDSANPQYGIAAKGTSLAFASIATYAAPITNVLTEQMDLAGLTVTDELSARVNGSAVTLTGASGPAGTGNFGNHPLYIGSRAGTSLRFNGRIYSLIVRGAQSTETQIEQTEQWISGKMGGGYYPTGYDFLVDANGDQITDASGNPLFTQALYT